MMSGNADVSLDRASQDRLNSLYRDKPNSYFGNARADIVDLLPRDQRSSILELGCGAGATGRMAMSRGCASEYVGIELSSEAAAIAAEHLSQVIVGNVETMDLSELHGRFDALIASEVLEHLIDPWSTLARLSRCLRPGARVFASSPNITHWKVVRQIAAGHFIYEEEGVFDRSHLRWFSPSSYAAMFEQAGFAVDSIQPIARAGWKGRLLDRLLGGRLAHLFMAQIMIIGHRR
jgi:2-polyprenyl-3-methyl-5-hydroxy-6-metoxy-1,4-benzoquinol methylase